MTFVGVDVVEGIQETRAVHGFLRDAVDYLGLRDSRCFEDGRTHVDAVRELRTQASLLDPVWPRDAHGVSRSPQVACHLLAPLEWNVTSVCPRRSVVRCSLNSAECFDAPVLVDEFQLLLGVERNAVEERHLVERTGKRSLHAGAVVAPDVKDECVVQVTHILDSIEQSADVTVGVLREAGVHFHLIGRASCRERV